MTFSITPVSTSTTEGGSITFTVTRSSGTGSQTVYVSTTQTEGYSNSSDYTSILNQALTFNSGETSKTVTVFTTNDSTVESSESFGFIVQQNSTDPVGTYLDKSTFTITDNDASTTTYAVTANPNPVTENNGVVNFTIARSGSLPSETVYVSTVNGSINGYATNSGDYAGVVSQGFSFASGETSKTFTVSLVNDGIAEAAETFGFIVQQNASDPVSTFLAKTNWTIQDDDNASTGYTVSANPNPVSENAGAVTFTITRSAGMPAETVYVSTVHGGANGYATNNTDYAGIANQPVSFATNELSKTVTVSVIDGADVESDETFGFIVQQNASDPIGAYLAKTNWTIQDDDFSASSLIVSLGPDITVNENDGYAVLTVSLDQPATQTTSVFYSTFYGTARAADADYDGVVDQKITFQPGEQQKQIKVFIHDDVANEAAEYFDVKLDNPQGLILGNASARVSILDNDAGSSFVVAQNSLAFIAHLSQAAYHIPQPALTNPNGVDSAEDASTLAQYNALSLISGFQFLTATDLPTLAPRSVSNPDFPVTGIVDGIFLNDNAAVLVGTIGDTLYIAFRGTNDPALTDPDHLHWLDKQSHYDLFSDDTANANFEDAINSYVSNHPTIKNVLVTGHSLGAAMAQEFYLRNASLPNIKVVTFASPGFEIIGQDVFDPKITNILVAGDIIRSAEYLGVTHGLKFIVDDATALPPINGVDLHDVNLYVAIAEYLTDRNIDPRSDAILDFQNGTDPHINLDINNLNNVWSVDAPNLVDEAIIESWNLFLTTAADETFAGGVYIASHLIAPVTIDLSLGIARGIGVGVDRLIDVVSAIAGAGDDLLRGNSFDNVLKGGAGSDRVYGGGGFDWLVGGSGEGDDYYDGGPDIDTVDFSSTSLGILVDLSELGDQASGPEIGVDQLVSIENVVGGTG
ncbi:MAG: Calx-beta domain-containing protein, partial [Pseudomonadota bacterium]